MNKMEKRQMVPWAPEEIKSVEAIHGNGSYYELENKKIMAFLKVQGIDVIEIKARKFQGDSELLSPNMTPLKMLPMNYGDQEDGISLEIIIRGKWGTKIPDWAHELIDRCRWNQWPKRLLDLDDGGWDECYDPCEWDGKLYDQACWHHTGIRWYAYFCQEETTVITLEWGICQCS